MAIIDAVSVMWDFVGSTIEDYPLAEPISGIKLYVVWARPYAFKIPVAKKFYMHTRKEEEDNECRQTCGAVNSTADRISGKLDPKEEEGEGGGRRRWDTGGGATHLTRNRIQKAA